MIISDVIAGLCWLYLNPERAGRKREQRQELERLAAESASL
jgi:hypothetical protein